jgi:hypothetical protein
MVFLRTPSRSILLLIEQISAANASRLSQGKTGVRHSGSCSGGKADIAIAKQRNLT